MTEGPPWLRACAQVSPGFLTDVLCSHSCNHCHHSSAVKEKLGRRTLKEKDILSTPSLDSPPQRPGKNQGPVPTWEQRAKYLEWNPEASPPSFHSSRISGNAGHIGTLRHSGQEKGKIRKKCVATKATGRLGNYLQVPRRTRP